MSSSWAVTFIASDPIGNFSLIVCDSESETNLGGLSLTSKTMTVKLDVTV